MKTTRALAFIAIAMSTISLPSCEQDVDPPSARCKGTFYAIKATPGINMSFTLHEFAKPLPEPFASKIIAGPFSLPDQSFFDIRSNFSAFDSISKLYGFHHFYGTGSQYFSFDTGTGIPTLTRTIGGDWTSFVFHGKPSRPQPPKPPVWMHSLSSMQTSSNQWFYSINEINPITGLDGVGLSGSEVTTNSPLFAEAMSSVSTDGDLIYFLSGTNLIEYNLSANTSRHMDIDPSYHPTDNNVHYFGLEYKRDQGLLLAMRNKSDNSGFPITELVSIRVTSGTSTVTTLFDISAGLPAGTERFVNPEFYSTAFDPCDNNYYITTLRGGEIISTRFIEISLPKNEMKQRLLDGYWYGLEFLGR